MRQLGSGSHLDNTRSYKSIDRDTPNNNPPRLTVSQSAPHTPVSSNHSEGALFKSVPRLLSEPIVGSRLKNSSPAIRSIDFKSSKSERNSPYLLDKKIDNLEINTDGDSTKNLRGPNIPVPIHSPKCLNKKESKFFLKSPLVKRETKIQIESTSKPDSTKNVITERTHV